MVLMVSGGADSTALLVMAATDVLDVQDGRGRAKITQSRLCVLHINHQLRGADAEKTSSLFAHFPPNMASRVWCARSTSHPLPRPTT